MAGFVHGAEQGRHGVISFKTSCDAHIIHIEGGFKWMGGLILPAAAPVVSILGDDIHTKIP